MAKKKDKQKQDHVGASALSAGARPEAEDEAQEVREGDGRRAGDGLLHAGGDRERFLELVPGVEKAMADDGIVLLK
jgi:hypothetical protein